MKKLFKAVAFMLTIGMFAQETEEKAFTVSGSVDAYFQTYLTASDDSDQSFGTPLPIKLDLHLVWPM